ncbi:MAG: ATP-binding protein [Nocardioidaceae bacterium]
MALDSRLRSGLRLRDRVAIGFALMALMLSVLVAVLVWLLASHYLNEQSRLSSRAQTQDNAALLRARIDEGEPPSIALVDSLRYSPGTASILVFGGHSYPNLEAQALDLPGDLPWHLGSATVDSRSVQVAGTRYLEVGASLGRPSRSYYELQPLADLDRTLTRTWMLLAAAAVLTSLVGAGVGRLASRRLLQPLTDVTAAAAAIAHGDLSARISPGRDPDLVRLAESFNRTAGDLEHRVQADARFAADVSHELRTPLTTMLNSLALLQNRRARLPAELNEPLDLLQEDLHRFRKLVVDLLDISRADEGFDDRDRESVVIADLVRRAADGAAGRRVTLVDDSAAELVMMADKRRLERVVGNLVENADTHGHRCTGVNLSAANGTVRLEVSDDGPGVPEAQRSRVFERFARNGSSGGSGVGLGLAIVARHVRYLGGEVEVDEAPGGGARFVVRLPVD